MPEWLQSNGPWGIIIPVGVLVGGVVYLVLRNLGRAEPEGSLVVAAVDNSQGERRANPRKRTTPVLVDLVDPAGVRPRVSAIVADCSTGGMKLHCQDEVPEASAWTVMPRTSATVKVGLPVAVRGCAREDDHFVVHCQFTRTVGYNELLNFS